MKNLFEELWYGNISPNSSMQTTSEVRKLRKDLSICYDNLLNELNEKQKKLFEEYDECNVELCAISERDIFKYAFKLGANFAIEMLKE